MAGRRRGSAVLPQQKRRHQGTPGQTHTLDGPDAVGTGLLIQVEAGLVNAPIGVCAAPRVHDAVDAPQEVVLAVVQGAQQ